MNHLSSALYLANRETASLFPASPTAQSQDTSKASPVVPLTMGASMEALLLPGACQPL